jgi:hypothetical protein
MTDGESASLSWCQAPISDPRPILYIYIYIYIFFRHLVMWGALSDEKSGL